MTVTSAPIGSTGQSLDGFAVNANVPDAFRESVVLTDPTDPLAAAAIVSTQPIALYGLPVWICGQPAVNIGGTVTVTGSVSTTALGVTSTFAVNPVAVSSTFVVNAANPVSTFAVNNPATVSTQIVSSIPFFVAQSSAPWDVRGNVGVTSFPAIVSTVVVSSVPHALVGTSQVFGTVSTQVVSSIPFFVAQSSAPWAVNGAVAVTNVPTVNVTNVPAVNITSSLPFFVAQSSAPWVVTGSTQIVSSIPFFVAQSSAPWSFVETVSTAGGMSATTIALVANLNTTVIKATAGQLYGVLGANVGSSVVFVRFLNASTAATAIASTGVALVNWGMPVSTSPYNNYDAGIPFSAGITIITQQQPYTASTSVSPTASTASVTILFK